MRRIGASAVVLVVLVLQVVGAAPASAHALLVSTDPPNGVRLERAPAAVTLRFSEPVDLVRGGLLLYDGSRRRLPTPEGTARGATVTWPMPSTLPAGAYVATWRVASIDGHPVAGTLSFGVGAAAEKVAAQDAAASAPPNVVLVRYLGYLGFAMLVGAVAFTSLCAPETRGSRRVQQVARSGIVVGVLATAAGVLVQGPYVAGEPFARIADQRLLSQTLGSAFGFWMIWRLTGYLALALMAWRLRWLDARTSRWPAGLLVVGLAATFGESGHALSSSTWTAPLVDTAHVLSAGVWVGGLVLLCLVDAATVAPALPRFSRLAMATVGVLVVTGVLNSLRHVGQVDDLWRTRYGVVLCVKLGLVGLALLAAAASRRTLGRRGSPWRSVRVEAALTVAVLAVTSVLTLTSPPPGAVGPAAGHDSTLH